MNVEIAQRLAELRREKGYSQEELAEKIGLSRQAVSKWERAESSPDTGNLVALAKLYGVTLDDLLRFDEDLEDDMKFESQDRTVSAEAKAQDAAEKASVAAAQATAAAAQVQATQAAAKVAQDQQSADAARARQAAEAARAQQATQPTQAYQAPQSAQAQQPTQPQAPGQFIPGIPGAPNGPGAPGAPRAPYQGYAQQPANTPNAGSGKHHGQGPWSTFPYPVLCVVVFLLAGFFFGAWHPAWVVFLTIPLYYWVASTIENDPNNRK